MSFRVPIYDGRANAGTGFSFTDKDFAGLTNLPLYRGGKRDLTDRAVVAVGYTVGTWEARESKENYLSTNLQFVILLGNAAAPL